MLMKLTPDTHGLSDNKNSVKNIGNYMENENQNQTSGFKKETAKAINPCDGNLNDLHRISEQKSYQEDENAKAMQRRLAEINAAILSLKTNLILCFAFCILFFCLSNISDPLKVLFTSLFKTLVPLLTTITNFGKILNAVFIYWENFVLKLQSFHTNSL
jgi:hypothetical protein